MVFNLKALQKTMPSFQEAAMLLSSHQFFQSNTAELEALKMLSTGRNSSTALSP